MSSTTSPSHPNRRVSFSVCAGPPPGRPGRYLAFTTDIASDRRLLARPRLTVRLLSSFQPPSKGSFSWTLVDTLTPPLWRTGFKVEVLEGRLWPRFFLPPAKNRGVYRQPLPLLTSLW